MLRFMEIALAFIITNDALPREYWDKAIKLMVDINWELNK